MRTCAICFEDADQPNPACPVPENHTEPIEEPDKRADLITWGTVQGRDVHLTCGDTSLTWAAFRTAVDGVGKNCAVCGGPLDKLPST